MRHLHILRFLLGAVPLVASLAFVPAGANAQAVDAEVQRSAAAAAAVGRAGKAMTSEPVCSPSPGTVTCLAELRTDIPAMANSSSGSVNPPGYHPRDIQSAYRLPVHAGSGRTVAVVSAFDNPNAESDLAVYRRTFHLPSCTTANGCFRKVNQTGGSTPPPLTNPAWATETALDIEAVSASCPSCKILLVEADTNSLSNMLTAVAQARTQGGKFISMSWGLPENASQPALDQTYFNFPGIAFVGASGNGGYSGFIYPAASPYVTAAGGTRLDRSLQPVPGPQEKRSGWYETAWSRSGSGCSQFQPKPPFQTDPDCPMRTVADVSALADPATGFAFYSTFNAPGWRVIGGTSVSSALIAGMYALAGKPGPADRPNSYPYAHRSAFWDIDQGSTGSCGGSYLCTAQIGYDGPTGVGTPRGVRGLRR
ncbi:peptidase S8 [Streptomyces antimycoticus]|uniref:Peptidase S8 n=1 Tax=Streptomyces antimycoticus TaxID=68175 RepID=A0A499UKD1_9ACTN|nr:peptidase S8 [Streptomyces antimycoticus]